MRKHKSHAVLVLTKYDINKEEGEQELEKVLFGGVEWREKRREPICLYKTER